jgi:uncharacterized protein (DUF433 family)
MLTLPSTYFTSETGPEHIPLIRFKGHAVEVASVLHDYRAGKTCEELAAWYDTIDSAALRAAIDYYHQQQAEVGRYLDAIQAYLQRVRQTTPIAPVRQRIEEYKRKHGLA